MIFFYENSFNCYYVKSFNFANNVEVVDVIIDYNDNDFNKI